MSDKVVTLVIKPRIQNSNVINRELSVYPSKIENEGVTPDSNISQQELILNNNRQLDTYQKGSVITNNSKNTRQLVMPNFNYNPSKPIPQRDMSFVVNKQHASEEEKVQRQKLMSAERYRKHKDKIKPFIELSYLPRINERIKNLWMLTFPDTNIDPQTMDVLVSQFVKSVSIYRENSNSQTKSTNGHQ